jgi:hypothetical protein
VRSVANRIAQLPEPSQGGVFDEGFVDVHLIGLISQSLEYSNCRLPS